MSAVASDIKVQSHSHAHALRRPAGSAGAPDGGTPFAALLDTAASGSNGADRPDPPSKTNRDGPAYATRKDDAPDGPPQASDSASLSNDSSTSPAGSDATAAAEPEAAQDSCATASEPDPASTETTDATDQTVADALALIDIPQPATPVPQVIVAAAIALPVEPVADPLASAAQDTTAAIATDAAGVRPADAAVDTAAALPPPAPVKTAANRSAGAKSAVDTDTDGQDKTADPSAAAKTLADNSQTNHTDAPHHTLRAKAGVTEDAATLAPTSGAAAERAADADAPAAQAATTAPNSDVASAVTLASHSNTQAASLAAATPANAATPLANAVPVAGLAVEIAAQAHAGGRRFEIRLDPPELGRIDVRLEVDRNGHVTSHLRVDRVETLDLLRRDSASLERALQDAGLKTSDNALNFSLRDQSLQQDAGDRSSRNTTYVAPDETALPVAAAQTGWAMRLGGIDIRV